MFLLFTNFMRALENGADETVRNLTFDTFTWEVDGAFDSVLNDSQNFNLNEDVLAITVAIITGIMMILLIDGD